MKLSVVTTLFRSAPHLHAFYTRMTEAVRNVTQDYEILLVNDGSPDESQDVALSLCEADPHVGLVELSRNFGHHKAMMTGLAHARGDLVFLIDCDLEEAPELVQTFHETMQASEADVVYGVQQRRRGGWFERVSGELAYRAFNFFSTDRIPNNIVTARLMTRKYVRNLVRHREREIMIAGLWTITGFRQVAVPVEKLSLNQTTYSLSHKLAIVVNHLTAFSNRPLVYIFYLGCLILALSIVMGVYLIVRRLFFGLLEGWASVMVSIWFLSGLAIFCIGILGIYLSKMFSEVKRRPYTIVRGRYGILTGQPRAVRQLRPSPSRQALCHSSHSSRAASPSGAVVLDQPVRSSVEANGMTREVILDKVADYYGRKLAEYGPIPQGVDWNGAESQEVRFSQLLKVVGDDRHFSLNDYGCGYGRLAGYLREQGIACEYRGFDVAPTMIEAAQKLQADCDNCSFTADEATLPLADYTVASGIFNVKLDTPEQDWTAYVVSSLARLNTLSRRGFAFNVLTRYSDPERMRPNLYYADPCFFFDYCKTHYSRSVALLHDYGLFEFTIIVRKVGSTTVSLPANPRDGIPS